MREIQSRITEKDVSVERIDSIQEYIRGVLEKSKAKLEEHFPAFYRDIPTKVNYNDSSTELKISYHFEDDDLNINIQTPEDPSGETVGNLGERETSFLVFQEHIAEEETITKSTQDFFFLLHEYVHGVNRVLLKEYRPDIVTIYESRRKEFAQSDEDTQKKLLREEQANSIFPVLGESLPISLERIIVEDILQDEKVDSEEKDNVGRFWDAHEKSLSSKILEKGSTSKKYSELDEAMIYYKIYETFGEKGILKFIKGFNFSQLEKIKRYSDTEEKVLSKEYKDFLRMNAHDIFASFCES